MAESKVDQFTKSKFPKWLRSYFMENPSIPMKLRGVCLMELQLVLPVRANDINDALEDGYDSSRDEVSSVSSHNPVKHNLHRSFGSSFSLHSSSARSLTRDPLEGSRMSLSSQMALPRLSVAEVLHDSAADVLSPQKFRNPFSAEEDAGVSSSPEAAAINSASSEGFIRGRSYNIRLDDQVLLKFSPKNSDSNYYFSDMIGGTLTFFHEERARRCLEV
ncbi:hypothetical protein K1719_046628 [Acacia pycnantha]|nr:hypothetical protein K1719_046628 [Acacia pycnantha]